MAPKRKKKTKKAFSAGLVLFLVLMICVLVFLILMRERSNTSLMALSVRTVKVVDEILEKNGFVLADSLMKIEHVRRDSGRPYKYVYRKISVTNQAIGLQSALTRGLGLTARLDRISVTVSFLPAEEGWQVQSLKIGRKNTVIYRLDLLVPEELQDFSSPPSYLFKREVKGRIALVIDDAGSERESLIQGYLEFPEKLTFAVIPGLPTTQDRVDRISMYSRFKMILHQPMQPKNSSERGIRLMENVILTNMNEQIVHEILKQGFAQVPSAHGMNNHQGSLATSHHRTMSYVMKYMKENGLFFMDSYTSADSVALQEAEQAGIKSYKRDIFLDHDVNAQKVQAQMDKLAQIALKRGWAIGIGHTTHQVTLDVLMDNVQAMEELGIEFVHLEEISGISGEIF